jgi:hypothetical protein
LEGFPSGQWEQAVNLPAFAFVGSNPTPSTSQYGKPACGARISAVRGPQADQTDDFRPMPSTSLTLAVRERPASRAGSSCERACARLVRAAGVCAAVGRRRVFSAGVAQLVERQPSKLNVASSNLVSRSVFFSEFWAPQPKTFSARAFGLPNPKTSRASASRRAGGLPGPNPGAKAFCFAHLAQLVEHVLGKDEVTSSILVVGSKRHRL